ncbi:MAG: phosphatase PAP2 family protein [Spirochaetales bacterium]|uniref:Phosphatase PAP2 family protein n=1 Tax=Candidatus Thalassospirochaeta sargassi TaxID=3119039 RepID=A0AAJ1IJS4_9SPIO|nr:phosphatase PAP2 family protein [Spirochaetales bacterium]
MITRVADGWVYFALMAVYLLARTSAALLVLPAFTAAYLLETGTYFLIKNNVKRVRPFKKIEGITSLVIPPDEFSFPSGHTAAATVFAVICSSSFPGSGPLMYSYAAIVGFSRIYNGVHYPGDIFAGAALGAVSAKTALVFF